MFRTERAILQQKSYIWIMETKTGNKHHLMQSAQKIKKYTKGLDFDAFLSDDKTIDAEKTRGREIASLQKTGDNFPKYIVTLDDFSLGTTREGIQIVHLRDFLRDRPLL